MILVVLLGMSRQSQCVKKALESCKELVDQCVNDHLCSYDLFVEANQPSYIPYFSNSLGENTYDCLSKQCSQLKPRVGRKELKALSSVGECLVRDGCRLDGEEDECVKRCKQA